MVGPVNNSIQTAYVNPFQQRVDDQNRTAEARPQENRPQPQGAASAGTQSLSQDKSKDTRQAQTYAQTDTTQDRSDARQSTAPRGSLLDVTA